MTTMSSKSGRNEDSSGNEIEMDEKASLLTDRSSTCNSSIIVYKERWLMLFIFSMNTMASGCLFMGLSPVTSIVAKYYRVNAVIVEWLSNMFLFVYIFVALPAAYAMSKYGIRPILIAAAALDAVATAFHFAGVDEDSFYFVLFGQICAALAYGCLLQIPGELSATWFPENERATSTSVGVFMNIFGVALGFLQPSLMIKCSDLNEEVRQGLWNFFLMQLIICLLIALLTFCFYKQEPPTPPSNIKHVEIESGFFKHLKKLATNKYFLFMSQAYSINFGLFVSVAVLISPFLTTKYTRRTALIGWMGFGSDLMAVFSCFLIGLWLDRYHGYQIVAIFLNLSSAIVWMAFSIIFFYTDSFVGIFIMIVLFGAVGIPYFASGLEQAAEMTYPIPEGTSSSVLLTLANIYGFIFVLLLGVLIDEERLYSTAYLMFTLYILATIFSFMAKTELNRKNAEDTADSAIDSSNEL